jgi:hypothetical protein
MLLGVLVFQYLWLDVLSVMNYASIDQKRKFYIYPWPDSILDLWPKIAQSTDDLHLTSSLNYGAGEIVDQSLGIYNTFQFGTHSYHYS